MKAFLQKNWIYLLVLLSFVPAILSVSLPYFRNGWPALIVSLISFSFCALYAFNLIFRDYFEKKGRNQKLGVQIFWKVIRITSYLVSCAMMLLFVKAIYDIFNLSIDFIFALAVINILLVVISLSVVITHYLDKILNNGV